MGDRKKEKTKSAASAIVATAIAAAAAIAAIVVLVIIINKPKETEKPAESAASVFEPTQELADECGAQAQRLMENNYKVIRLFVKEGLPREAEPYGNRPEDGFYTVNSTEYMAYEQIEELVKSTYTETEARRILTQMPSDPSAADGESGGSDSEPIAVYGTREIYVDVPAEVSDGAETDGDEDDENGGDSPERPSYEKKTVLGINELFKPYTAYSKPWGSISIRVLPLSEEECDITVYLGADKDVNLSSVDETDILSTKMIKENGEWYLESLIY